MIDRKALVSRHDVILGGLDPFSPLSVGNGEFAFTADVTGLQTFLPREAGATPLCTMAQWGWHSYPERPGLSRSESALRLERFERAGRGSQSGGSVGYMTDPRGQEELFSDLRINPHRLNLARLGFIIGEKGASGGLSYRRPRPVELARASQRLRLWEGLLESEFNLAGVEVRCQTLVHPEIDILAVRVVSPGLVDGRLAINLAFPYSSHLPEASDWDSPSRHMTQDEEDSSGDGCFSRSVKIRRSLDADAYCLRLGLGPQCSIRRTGQHEYLVSSRSGVLELCLSFGPGYEAPPPCSWTLCHEACGRGWRSFWESGAAIDLSRSGDSRAPELERRIVLSQYLTKIQCSGSLPPQETGLTCNSWYGKFHLEMHYWHGAHFALWGRPELLARSLGWYGRILGSARSRAKGQGYQGARWPKMTDPSGRDSPSPIGPLLCWQQPHPIMYAELLLRSGILRDGQADSCDLSLELLDELVFETAEFMADYALKTEDGRYHLLGPLIPAQESHDPRVVSDPAFELEYWRWALGAAAAWARKRRSSGSSKRLGSTVWIEAEAHWEKVGSGLASLPRGEGGIYLAHASCPDTFGRFAVDHPSMLFALGMLPGPSVDRRVMGRTYDAVLSSWDFSSSWGWDFPAMAMCAARLGRKKEAVDALFFESPKNLYRPNGHNAQLSRASGPRLGSVPGRRESEASGTLLYETKLPLYLPGNGALLAAVAMMAGGWDGSGGNDSEGRRPCPGFPEAPDWIPRSEGFIRAP